MLGVRRRPRRHQSSADRIGTEGGRRERLRWNTPIADLADWQIDTNTEAEAEAVTHGGRSRGRDRDGDKQQSVTQADITCGRLLTLTGWPR